MDSLTETYETAPPLRLTVGLTMVTLATVAWTLHSMDRLMALDGPSLMTLGVLLMVLSGVLWVWLDRNH